MHMSIVVPEFTLTPVRSKFLFTFQAKRVGPPNFPLGKCQLQIRVDICHSKSFVRLNNNRNMYK